MEYEYMGLLNAGLYLFYIMLFVAVVGAIVFSLMNQFRNTASLIKSLITLGLVVVVFLVFYSMADGSVTEKEIAQGINSVSVKMISGGLWVFYIALGAAFLSLVYAEISKAFK